MDLKRQKKPISTKCTICGATTIYSYFGVIACQPCKEFFRKRAKQGLEVLACFFDGHCEINVGNRRTCAYCRLMKCFQSGMQTELIRSSHSKSNKTKQLLPFTGTRSFALVRSHKLPTLNLLECDQSRLTADQWSLLSNLSHCYDEHSGLAMGEHFMAEQNLLPPKMRFKTTQMIDFIQRTLHESQFLYRNNLDFLSLSMNDRSILLHNTLKHVGSLSSNFIIYKVQLMSCSTYFDTIGSISHPNIVPAARRVANRLDFDMIVMKLFLAILAVSTINFTVYSNYTIPMNLSNIKQVLRIQDTYVELLWRYLLYKYSFVRAVKCLSELIRCFCAIHNAAVVTHDIQWLTDTIDYLVQQTERTLTLSS